MNTDRPRILITGMGAVSPFGTGLDALWVGDVSGKVYRVDPVTSQSTLFYRAGGAITSLMPDENRGVLWVDVGSPDS